MTEVQQQLASPSPQSLVWPLNWLDAGWEWLKDLANVLWLCRFSFGILVAALIVLLVNEQGQEVIYAIGERPLDGLHFGFSLAFFATAGLWAFMTWYSARVILRFDFRRCPLGETNCPLKPERIRRFSKHIPRLLGTGVFAVIAAAFVKVATSAWAVDDSDTFWILALYGFISLALAGAFFLFAFKRRHLMKRYMSGLIEDVDHSIKEIRPAEYRTLPRLTWIALGIALVVGLASCLWASFGSISMGTFFGPAMIFFLAAAAWVPLGSIFVFLGSRTTFPFIGLFIALAFGFSWFDFSDNHDVRKVDGTKYKDGYAARPDLNEYFAQLASAIPPRNGDKVPKNGSKVPLVIVVSAGGGSRAAYWTATVLGKLQDKNSNFSDHLVAMSGVSGGSLGIGVFAALMAQGQSEKPKCQPKYNKEPAEGFKACSQAILAEDFLGPNLAAFFFPDLVQKFAPIQRILPFEILDRAGAIEGAWERAWNRAEPSGNDPVSLEHPFLSVLGSGEKPYFPVILFNGTSVSTGKRIITSNYRFVSADQLIDRGADPVFADSFDGFSILERDTPISTAISMSTRFPYVQPPGTLRYKNDDGETVLWDRIVDGGYFENFGAVTAEGFLRRLQKWRSEDSHDFDYYPLVIQISSDPEFTPATIESNADLMPCPSPDGTRCRKVARFANALWSPPETLLKTRNARGAYAAASLQQRTFDADGCYFHLRLHSVKSGKQAQLGELKDGQKKDPPLGWFLSERATDQLDAQLDHPQNKAHIEAIGARLESGEFIECPKN